MNEQKVSITGNRYTFRCSRENRVAKERRKIENQKEGNLNLIDGKTNHTQKSINFIHFTYVPSSSRPPISLNTNTNQRKFLLKNRVLGEKQFLMEINVRQDKKRKKERR